MTSRLAFLPALAALAVALLVPSGRLELPWLMLGVIFELDALGRLFLGFTAFLWGAAAVQSHAYLAGDPGRGRYAGFFLAAMLGNLGLVLAGDLLSFLSFFALMSFSTYGLVVHAGTGEARRAGRVYLALVVVGEVLLFSGLALAVGGTAVVSASAVGASAVSASAVSEGVAAGRWGPLAGILLFAGFGVKAGALPLHGWLPLAHPVAPAPASAVMSGAMIKAGLLGWLRFLPLGAVAAPSAGRAVLVLGLLAAFYAALVGVTQERPKTVLAYSSISQMGLITAGVGVALAAPAAWPVLATAVALYAVHHALAKGALFMGTAVLSHGGGRRAWALLFLPALALAGAPLTSGAVAKTALKGALESALGPAGGGVLTLLAVAAVGTTLLMARFLFLARPPAAGTLPRSGGAASAHGIPSPSGHAPSPSGHAPSPSGHGPAPSGHGPAPSQDGGGHAAGLWAPWLAVVAASLAVPWWVAPEGAAAKAFDSGSLATLVWPIAAGLGVAAAAWALGRRKGLRLPRIPQGDYLTALLDARPR